MKKRKHEIKRPARSRGVVTKQIADACERANACYRPEVGMKFKEFPDKDLAWAVCNVPNLKHQDRLAMSYLCGVQAYWKNGKRHRENGPAIVYPNGSYQWWKNGKRHRSGGGPAIRWPNGTLMWYRHGKLHRKDGPAIEYSDGGNQWWLNDIPVSKSKHKQLTKGKTK